MSYKILLILFWFLELRHNFCNTLFLSVKCFIFVFFCFLKQSILSNTEVDMVSFSLFSMSLIWKPACHGEKTSVIFKFIAVWKALIFYHVNECDLNELLQVTIFYLSCLSDDTELLLKFLLINLQGLERPEYSWTLKRTALMLGILYWVAYSLCKCCYI